MMNKLLIPIILFELIITTGCQIRQPDRSGYLQSDTLITTGNAIAFCRLTDNYWQIWTMRPDGSGQEQITTSLSDKRYPAWSKNGDALFYQTNNRQAFRMELTSGKEQQIFTSLGLIGAPVPSPRDDRFLIPRFRSQLMDTGNLWTVISDSSNAKRITMDAGLQYDPSWSSDGRRIAYIGGQGYRRHELYITDSDGKNKRRLTNNKAMEAVPAFSPDGKTIAYASDITGDYEIWLMDPDGANHRQLTNSEGIDTRPCWSPDGKQIMFVSNRNGTLQLWIMNSDGGNPQQLTDGLPRMDPVWRRR
jgi:TolB protein